MNILSYLEKKISKFKIVSLYMYKAFEASDTLIAKVQVLENK